MAAGDILTAYGSSIKWTDSSGDKAIAINGLAADGTVVGAYLDRGVLTTPRPQTYKFELHVQGFGTIMESGRMVLPYVAESEDGVNFDGRLDPTGLSETTGATNGPPTTMLGNMEPLKAARTYSTTAADILIVRGTFQVVKRYWTPIIHNGVDQAFASGANIHYFEATPFWQQVEQ